MHLTVGPILHKNISHKVAGSVGSGGRKDPFKRLRGKVSEESENSDRELS